MKEKVVTFNKWRTVRFKRTKKFRYPKARNWIIEQELSKGYVPANIEFRDDVESSDIIATYLAAYAGKRTAREFGYQEIKVDRVRIAYE